MECSFPPQLSDEILSTVLDGLADEAVHRHLSQCPACAARLAEMERMDTFLGTRLKRFQCPSARQLGDYHAEMLEADAADEIRQHVTDCPRCQHELALLEAFLNLPPEAPAPAENIIPLWTPPNVYKARHVQTAGSLALKGLKGADDETSHDVKAGTATIYLESKAVPTGFLVTGQVLDSEVDWAGAIAEARVSDGAQQVCILDEMCEFRFQFSHAGSLDLSITASSGVTLVVENVTIQS